KRRGFDVTKPHNQLSQAERTLLWEGDTGKGPVEGIKAFFEYLEGKRYKLHVRVMLSRYRSPVSCDTCKGTRLRPEALAVRVGSRTIAEVADLTIALHARDTATLAGILSDLAKAGNTVIMVEHDRTMIESAHFVVEMGPAAGEKGGEVVCAARYPEFLVHPTALTARYLSGQETI